MVISTGWVTSPRNALGNPSRLACQLSPTVAQEIVEEMLHERSAKGSSASFTASMDSCSAASRPITPASRMTTNAPVW